MTALIVLQRKQHKDSGERKRSKQCSAPKLKGQARERLHANKTTGLTISTRVTQIPKVANLNIPAKNASKANTSLSQDQSPTSLRLKSSDDFDTRTALEIDQKFLENGLQVIVKLANIHLTPDKPSYDRGSWHVEVSPVTAVRATLTAPLTSEQRVSQMSTSAAAPFITTTATTSLILIWLFAKVLTTNT